MHNIFKINLKIFQKYLKIFKKFSKQISKNFRKFFKIFLRKLLKCIILALFSHNLTRQGVNFCGFGPKTQFVEHF